MTTIVAAILNKGRRPREFLSALRAKTRPIAALPRSLDAWKSAQTGTPRNVLDGDLLGLLGDRMRALLRRDGQGAEEVGAPGIGDPKFADHVEFTRPSAAPFYRNSESGKTRERGFTAIEAALQRRVSLTAPAGPRRAYAPADPFTARRFHEVSRRRWETARVAVGDRDSFPPGGVAATARGRSGGGAGSPLAEKLREYWELSGTRKEAGKESNRTAGAATNGEALAIPEPPPPAARTSRSWPEITARQLERKLRSASTDLSSTRATQTVGAGSPEKVEIQNVFNIEVKPAGGGGAGDDGLPERLADILFEQALQHGIDVT